MDYAALAADAAALITEFGQPATLRRVVSLGYDPGLTITVDATGKTFTRSSGSWITDGFIAGDTVVFTGFLDAGNNAGFVASTVAALVLTCATAAGLVNVTDAAGVSASATRDVACSAFKESSNSKVLYEASLIPGSLIATGTRFYLIASPTKPQVNDKLILSLEPDANLVIRDGDPLSPGGVDITYTVRVSS